MFVQIYLKKRTESTVTYQDVASLLGSFSRTTTPGEIVLEERVKDKITTHNYRVPPGYKWWETQHWCLINKDVYYEQETECSFKSI
jgi:hypothetical protein